VSTEERERQHFNLTLLAMVALIAVTLLAELLT